MTPDSSAALPLGTGEEFDAIRSLTHRWGPLAVGIGDDAAVLELPRGDRLVASVDAFVEGRHFRRGWLTPREVGYRATMAALSDLAAMASRPVGILVALSVPAAWRDELPELADGIGDASRDAGTVIRGGNLTGGNELSIVTTVLGAAFAPLSRRGARAGDEVLVTGRLGGPGAALDLLVDGRPAGVHHDRFARPAARIAEARWLADHGATSAIDISDGLAADARHLAAAGGVAIEIDGAALPLVAGVTLDQALVSGEEYELLVTAPRGVDAAEFTRRFGIPLTRIGRVASDGSARVTIAGARVAAAPGFDHFSR